MSANTQTLSIQQFAFNVGAMGKQVRTAAQPFHDAYKGADKVGQAQLRKEWMLGHLMGAEGLTEVAGEKILSQGKGAGASKANVAAIDRAYSDFRYYVINGQIKAKGKVEEALEMEIPEEVMAAALRLVKLANEYDCDVKKLAATAVAKAFAASK